MTAVGGAILEAPHATLGAMGRLEALVRHREILGPPFRKVMESVALDRGEAEAWAQAVLDLAYVNAGPSALISFWRISARSTARIGAEAVGAVAVAAADICRHAGAQAARAVLDVRRDLAERLDDLPRSAEAAWWGAWLRMAREAPACIVALAPHARTILDAAGVEGFADFVAAGLRATGGGLARQRLAFFRLEDPQARHMLERLRGTVTFTAVRQRLRAFATALWGVCPPIRAVEQRLDAQPMRRTSIAGGMVRVPDIFPGAPADTADRLFTAAVAHATAHLALGGRRFDIGTLKPLQIVLVGLVEDARIEALAMRRFPGLRRLWAPFHVAQPSTVSTAPVLLARLARALFDPAYADHDGFVAKGRTLFAAAPGLEDPDLSRRVGGLLGNDLGQMRIQFNAKTWVIEPPYRDDGLGLWNFPTPPDAPPNAEMHVEAARAQTGEGGRDRPDGEDSEPVGRARAVAADQRGIVVATYPEWDRAAEIERHDWTTVREIAPAWGDPQTIDMVVEREAGLRARVERLVRGARLGRRQRLRRQADGTDFDLDAVVDSAIELRLGELPDDRIHRLSVPRLRDVAVMVLTDTSQSTADRVGVSGTSILAVEKLAVAVLASAMQALGDTFALRAFASSGREDVRFVRVKDFDGLFDGEAKGRLAGLQSGLSTRLGTALRHAGAELARVKATRKILLALTDGAPSDIDVTDPLDLIEDARRATLSLRLHGIDCFGIVLDPTGQGAGAAVFGRTSHLPVRRTEELPTRLAELYFRVARR